MTTRVALCVATYRRPELLTELLQSFAALRVPAGWEVELRLVDNDGEASARSIVEGVDFGDVFAGGVDYMVQATRGIAEARNAAVDRGPADWFLFVDDDEVVPMHWLEAFEATTRLTDAEILIGAVSPLLPPGTPSWVARGGFFEKNTGPDAKLLDWRAGRTSNTLVKGELFAEARFNPSFSKSGGSDSELFHRMWREGARLVACDSARVLESIEPERVNARWLTRRSLRTGLVFELISPAPSPVVRSGWRLLKAAGKALVGLVPALIGRPERLVRAAQLVALTHGGLKARYSPTWATQFVEYRERALPPQQSGPAAVPDSGTQHKDAA